MSYPLLLILLVAVIAGLGFLSYTSSFTGIQIENPEPSSILGNERDQPTINFQIHSYEDKFWENITGTLEIENLSDQYISVKSVELGSFQLGDDAFRTLSMQPIEILDSEGMEIVYDGKITLFDTEGRLDFHNIEIKIQPNHIPDTSQKSKFDKHDIEFDGLDSKHLTISELRGKNIEFKVKSNVDGNFDSIKIIPEIYNDSGNFVKIESYQSDEHLQKTGDETGKISIPIEALNSEGKEIKYQLLLILYNGNERMDTEKIELIIIP